MNYQQQHTIVEPISFAGIGLHTGKRTQVTIHPAAAAHGIVFQHAAKSGVSTDIAATWQHTTSMPLCTCLTANGVYIRTVEHLLAACYACGVDNALIEIHGNEIPLLDGSSYPIVTAIEQVGTQTQAQAKKRIRVLKTVRVAEKERYLQIEPADDFSVDIGIHLAKWGELRWQGVLTPSIFKEQMIAARTFGRLHNGLLAKLFSVFSKTPVCLGANLHNCLVLLGSNVLNKGGLRMPDEFIRHRVLDLMGDLMLAQAPLLGKITGFSTAHRLNQQLLAQLLSDKTAWCWDES
jgi:UDP-3-O-[3-hydroxymyristoyl] N-acetylglucosamine deacetylase